MKNGPRLAVLARMLRSVSRRRFTQDVFGLPGYFGGRHQWRVVREPNINRGPVLDVIRKKLAPQLLGHEYSGDQQYQRAGEYLPAVLDGPCRDARIGAGESVLPSLLYRRFRLSAGSKQVVSEQRNKRHRYQPRGDQRASHHDGQAVKKLPGIPG